MTIWSIPLTGINGRRPMSEEWKPAYKHDTRIILDGVSLPEIPLPHFHGVSLCHYEYLKQDIQSKFKGEFDFLHLEPHLPTTYCEIIINDSFWKPPFMPDYPGHDDILKLQTVIAAADTLITALRLVGFNQCIVPCILKNGSLTSAPNCEDGSIEFYPHHPFLIPMPMLNKGKARLSRKDFEWVCKAHLTLYELAFTSDITPTMTAMSYYYHDMPPRAKMSLIWAAIEDLLKPGKSGIRFGIRSRGAMLLGRSDEEIEDFYKHIGKLYDKRSAATHGRKFTYNQGLEISPDNDRLFEDISDIGTSYVLLCEILIRVIDKGSLITESELDELEEQYKKKFPE